MNKKKFFMSLLITLLVLCVAFSSIIFYSPGGGVSYRSLDKENSKGKNILITGVDKEGVRADVIMLLNINPKGVVLWFQR